MWSPDHACTHEVEAAHCSRKTCLRAVCMFTAGAMFCLPPVLVYAACFCLKSRLPRLASRALNLPSRVSIDVTLSGDLLFPQNCVPINLWSSRTYRFNRRETKIAALSLTHCLCSLVKWSGRTISSLLFSRATCFIRTFLFFLRII